MNSAVSASLAAASLLTAAGCVIKVHSHEPHHHAWIDSQPGNYAGAIRAASTIEFSNDRCATLATIASKPDIDHASQIALINALRGGWGFSSDKTSVLQQLAANPALTPGASVHIANNLEKIATFSTDRKKIADLLAARPLPTATQAPAGTAAPAAEPVR